MASPVPNPAVRVAVVHDDGDLLIVIKERGVVTAPGEGHARDSLLSGVAALYGDRLAALGQRRDYGLLHRLDRATSGLVAIALSAAAYDALREAFATRRVEKTYLAVTRSPPPRPHGTVRQRLLEARRQDRKLALVDPRGEPAVTHWDTLAAGRDGGALVRCSIETGRLHQIRAHLAWLGCPLAGDAVYAARPPDGRGSVARRADREILLHAWRLRLPHGPRGGVAAEAPLPAYWDDWARASGVSLRRALRDAAARPEHPS